jgi:glycyl-tRNA synthetase beta chain
MGGIYAREESLPEQVWKAIYYHYLPIGVEAEAPPSRAQLGNATLTWAAVALADKLDTLVGLFAAGEKPTGSRDPYGLRRAGQGVVKILTDLPQLEVPNPRVDLSAMLARAYEPHASLGGGKPDGWRTLDIGTFLWERKQHLLERRGFRADEIRVVGALANSTGYPYGSLQRVEALAKVRSSEDFQALASLFKRVKNITKGVDDRGGSLREIRSVLKEPPELALADELITRSPTIEAALKERHYGRAMQELGALYPSVDRFFTDVLVMAEDQELRRARLALLAHLRGVILTNIGDIAEIAPEH